MKYRAGETRKTDAFVSFSVLSVNGDRVPEERSLPWEKETKPRDVAVEREDVRSSRKDLSSRDSTSPLRKASCSQVSGFRTLANPICIICEYSRARARADFSTDFILFPFFISQKNRIHLFIKNVVLRI